MSHPNTSTSAEIVSRADPPSHGHQKDQTLVTFSRDGHGIHDETASESESETRKGGKDLPPNLARESEAAIIKAYNELHGKSDKEFLESWTENLNSLLTFAGLLSAIVTAFIIEAGSGIETKPNPVDITNNLLIQMLKQNGGVSIVLEPRAASTLPDEVRSLLYASLFSSLLAAFGTLLTKEWVAHFRHKAPWIDTPREICYVRELRSQGLVLWKFIALMEGLSILLQLSLLLFGVGLFQSLGPQRSFARALVGGFILVGALFYLVTLVCGVIFSRCPFKTPWTEYCLRFAVFLLLRPARIFTLAILTLLDISSLRNTLPSHPSSLTSDLPSPPYKEENLRSPQIHPVTDSTSRPTSRIKQEKWFESTSWKAGFSQIRDDRRLMNQNMIAEAKTGVYFWAIQHEGSSLDVLAAKESILHMQKKMTRHVIRLEGMVHDWHTRVENRSVSDSMEPLKIHGEVIFYGLSSDDKYRFDFSPCYASDIARAIRTVWGRGNKSRLQLGGAEPSHPLPLPTAAAYVSAELRAALQIDSWGQWEAPMTLQSELTSWFHELKEPTLDIPTLAETLALVACMVSPRHRMRIQRYHVNPYTFGRGHLAWEEGMVASLEVLWGDVTHGAHQKHQSICDGVVKVLRLHLSISTTSKTRTSEKPKKLAIVNALKDPRILKVSLDAAPKHPSHYTRQTLVTLPSIQFLDMVLGIRYFTSPGLYTITSSPIPLSPVTPPKNNKGVRDAIRIHPDLLSCLSSVMNPTSHLRHYGLSMLIKAADLLLPLDNNNRNAGLVTELQQARDTFIQNDENGAQLAGDVNEFKSWEEARNAMLSRAEELRHELGAAAHTLGEMFTNLRRSTIASFSVAAPASPV